MTRDEIEKRVKQIIVEIRGIDGLEIGIEWPLQRVRLARPQITPLQRGYINQL